MTAPVKKTLADLLAESKAKALAAQANKPKADDILFGTGLTKKVATSQQKQLAKELTTVKAATANPLDKLRQMATAREAARNEALLAKEPPKTSAELQAKQPPVIKLEPSLPLEPELTYDESQLAAINGGTKQKYFTVIGAAGTGKTTVTKAIIKCLKDNLPLVDLNYARVGPKGEDVKPDLNLAICFCAFTGRAVQQLKRAIPKEYHPMANTIHATLGYMPTFEMRTDAETGLEKETMIFRPTFGKSLKLPYKIYVIDEGGMVPIYLMNELMDAMDDDAQIIMLGDINQLPPVQGRSVLGFAMSQWPTFELKHIHRQAQDNPIIGNAHNILNGKFPKPAPMKFDVVDLTQKAPGSIAASNAIVQVVQGLTRAGQFDPLKDALIVPQNKGELGQLNLNERLVTFFNPEKRDAGTGVIINKRTMIQTGLTTVTFAVGDKVMLLQNDRERQLTNGMIGVIEEINLNGMFDSSRANISPTGVHHDVTLDASDIEFELEAASEEASGKKEKEDQNQRQASHVVRVRFFDRQKASDLEDGLVDFRTAGQFRKITHAYAITCHKSQGGEYPTVVILIHSANAKMLSREWLYTAVTRARERVVLVCNQRGLAQSINTQRVKGATLQAKIDSFIAYSEMQIAVPELASTYTVARLPAPKEL